MLPLKQIAKQTLIQMTSSLVQCFVWKMKGNFIMVGCWVVLGFFSVLIFSLKIRNPQICYPLKPASMEWMGWEKKASFFAKQLFTSFSNRKLRFCFSFAKLSCILFERKWKGGDRVGQGKKYIQTTANWGIFSFGFLAVALLLLWYRDFPVV